MSFQRKPDSEVTEATLRSRARKARDKAYVEARKAAPPKDRTQRLASDGTRSKPADDTTIGKLSEDLSALMRVHPDLGYRMMAVRLMLEHRRISVADVMKVTARSHEWVLRCIRPSLVHLTNDYSHPNKVSPKVAHERLDALESAITLLTEQRGGMLASCGCPPSALVDLAEDLHHARLSST